MQDIASALTNSLSRNGEGGMLVPMKFADGNMGAPGIAFSSEPSLGIFRAALKDLEVTVAGQSRMRWTDVGVDVWNAAVLPSGAWVPIVNATGLALPFLPLAGGTVTGNVALGGNVGIGGTTTFNGVAVFANVAQFRDTNPIYFFAGDDTTNWGRLRGVVGGMLYDTIVGTHPHVFYTGGGERFRISDLSSIFTTPIGYNITPTTPLDIKGNGNATATYDDGLMIHSNNLTVWTKYSWNGISAVTTLPLAINGTKVAELGSGGLSILNGKLLALYNVGSSAGKALQIGGADEIIVTGKGGMLYFDDAANTTGKVIVQTSDPAASGLPPGTIVLVRDA
jgi:hypothetical protein